MAGLRFLHTADVHLGAAFRFLGTRGKEQRAQLKSTFSRVVDLALTSEVDAVLIAGDLFETAYPHSALVGEVIYQLGRLNAEGIWIFIVPGTHDRIVPGCVYESDDLAGLSHLHIFMDREMSPLYIEGLDLTVYGRATCAEHGDVLEGFHAHNGSRWRVGMLHASFFIPGKVEDDEMIVTEESISSSGLDYLALGHWHDTADYSRGGVPVFYSGSPESLEMGRGEVGKVVLVDLEEGCDAAVKYVPVGRRRLLRMELDAADVGDPSQLYAVLRRKADQDLGLEVQVKNAWGEEWSECDWDGLEEELASLFFHLVLEPVPGGLTRQDVQAYPEKTVVGRFVRMASSEMSGLEGRDAKVAEEALRLGLCYILGGSDAR
ncbi:MAG: DNA repair exonuclease [Actinomycetota bacterium]|nr:DNA repair exonuclease [Actinomycetota bacterium]